MRILAIRLALIIFVAYISVFWLALVFGTAIWEVLHGRNPSDELATLWHETFDGLMVLTAAFRDPLATTGEEDTHGV